MGYPYSSGVNQKVQLQIKVMEPHRVTWNEFKNGFKNFECRGKSSMNNFVH